MPTHAEQRVLPYSQDQLFDLVADVERYPEFLPWCVGARIRKQLPDGTMEADLVIGFKMFRERFASELGIPVDELDERVPIALEKLLSAYRPNDHTELESRSRDADGN